MAKLYFRYSAMNGGKSTALLQTAYNYEERGMKVAIIKPAIDSKGDDKVVSRLGLERTADIMLSSDDDVRDAINAHSGVHCVLIDEAQFLTLQQVDDLFWYAVESDIPVLAYGLRTDFSMTAFPGAARLLQLAHEITELKTICRCGKKAIFNARKVDGKFTMVGNQVEIDDKANVEYEALCAKDYKQLVIGPANA